MPKLASWHSDMSSQGLVVIGAHVQRATPDQIKSTAQSRGANFTVLENARVQGGDDFSGIPHCMLFDHTGKCVFRGHPGEVEGLLRKAVAQAPPAVLEGKKLNKLSSLLALLKKEQNYAQVLKQAQEKSSAKDEATAEEAKYVVEKLTGLAKKQLEQVDGKKEADPLASWKLVNRVATNFKGTDLGKEAADKVTAFKGDKAFQGDLKAFQTLDQVKGLKALLRSPPGNPPPDSAAYRALNGNVLQRMNNLIRELKKSAPDSKATKEALEIAEAAGLNVS
jgi:hypothetical protein